MLKAFQNAQCNDFSVLDSVYICISALHHCTGSQDHVVELRTQVSLKYGDFQRLHCIFFSNLSFLFAEVNFRTARRHNTQNFHGRKAGANEHF